MVGSGFDAGGAVRRRAMRHERVPGLRGIGSALVPVFALAFAVSVAGCSGSSGPDKTFTPTATEKYVPPTPTGSADASPSAGSSPSAGEYQPATETSPAKNVPVPKYPKAARANTEEGQKAFIEYWFKTYDYAMDTGDPTLFKKASDPACEYCNYNIKMLKQMHEEDKAWRVGGGTTVEAGSMKAGPETDGTLPWDVPVNAEGLHVYNATGPAPGYDGDGSLSAVMRVWLVRDNSSWQMRGAATVDGSEKRQ